MTVLGNEEGSVFVCCESESKTLNPSFCRAKSWFHLAKKICDLPEFVWLLVQDIVCPSGEKLGKPSNPSRSVTRTGSFRPLESTM